MPSYRFYPLDRTGRIIAPAVDHELPHDEAACEHARFLLSEHHEHHAAQVWQGQRLVHCATRDLRAS